VCRTQSAATLCLGSSARALHTLLSSARGRPHSAGHPSSAGPTGRQQMGAPDRLGRRRAGWEKAKLPTSSPAEISVQRGWPTHSLIEANLFGLFPRKGPTLRLARASNCTLGPPGGRHLSPPFACGSPSGRNSLRTGRPRRLAAAEDSYGEATSLRGCSRLHLPLPPPGQRRVGKNVNMEWTLGREVSPFLMDGSHSIDWGNGPCGLITAPQSTCCERVCIVGVVFGRFSIRFSIRFSVPFSVRALRAAGNSVRNFSGPEFAAEFTAEITAVNSEFRSELARFSRRKVPFHGPIGGGNLPTRQPVVSASSQCQSAGQFARIGSPNCTPKARRAAETRFTTVSEWPKLIPRAHPKGSLQRTIGKAHCKAARAHWKGSSQCSVGNCFPSASFLLQLGGESFPAQLWLASSQSSSIFSGKVCSKCNCSKRERERKR